MQETERDPSPPSGPHPDSTRDASPCDVPVKKDQDRKRQEAQWRNELYRLKKPLQERLEEVEGRLEKMQEELDRLNDLLAQPATYQDGSRVQDLQKEYQECRQQLQQLTEQWEQEALALEELEANFQQEKSL